MIPTITVDQMREVDRLMVEEMGIELIQMMENAGRCLAQHVRLELGGDVRRRWLRDRCRVELASSPRRSDRMPALLAS